MTDKEDKLAIQSAIKSFTSGNLTDRAISLFKTLGYHTDRKAPFSQKTYACFKDSFLEGNTRFNEEKALAKEWKSVDLLFQLTKDEVSDQKSMFGTGKVKWEGEDKETVIETYLFFALELTKAEYTRTALAQITREINKVFPMPVMLVFKHGEHLTLSVINRRLNKKDEQKDVLEKVTLIKDISVANPHRAHIEILFDLSFEELKQEYKVTNFVELHNAWQKTLDTKELNKKFFQEISNWYFWAMEHVSFPEDVEKNASVRNATSLIRLITRMIFIWFIREKNLIPHNIFDRLEISKILKGFYQDKKSHNYYLAILQNLFFATLNQKMGARKFAQEGGLTANKMEYGVKTLFRYLNLFAITEQEALSLFEDVPFLNGGLFDCLDKEDDAGKVFYVDGFSRNPQKQAIVPDFLFLGDEEVYDLNQIYDTRNKNYKVKGLFNILSGYKFTITENTPVEEEIALDPELLGKVFENLLASYNPETQTTARKQTGSFYTPREIVSYMVDESLKASLKQKLETEAGMAAQDVDVALGFLFEYNEKEHLFDEKQTAVLIKAIDNCKILDPACGSGAFPMGMLHTLVHILEKLDPHNRLWKERQIKKLDAIEDSQLREQLIADIESAFEHNELDYGRKLYLIENCIYGVDIQPIAIQISKLRFFISLIVDQKVNRTKENFGIRSLPNLETKFVAANTLIGLKKPQQMPLKNPAISALEKELKELRHKYFSEKTRKGKLDCQRKDKELRKEISTLLVKDGWGSETAKQVAAFDPYDQNASSAWFDAEWMFGVMEGFDVLIANPPYVGHKGGQKVFFRKIKETSLGRRFNNERMDLFYYFFHKSIDISSNNSVVIFITTNYYTTADSAVKLRTDFRNRISISKLVNLGEVTVFESATGQHNLITMLTKPQANIVCEIVSTNRTGTITLDELRSILNKADEQTSYSYLKQTDLYEGSHNYIRISSSSGTDGSNLIPKILQKMQVNFRDLGILCHVSQGIVTGIDKISKKHIEKYPHLHLIDGEGVYVVDNAIAKKLDDKEVVKPWFKNSDIEKFTTSTRNTKWVIHVTTDVDLPKHKNVYKHLSKFESIIKSRNFESGELSKAKRLGKWWALSSARKEFNFTVPKIVAPQRSEANTFGYNEIPWYASADVYFITQKDTSISLKYLLALLNSKLYYLWLYHRGKRKGASLELYQKPLSEIPIKKITDDEQKPFIKLIDRILAAKRDDRAVDTSVLESEIDRLVYELYGLTDEEIAVIKGNEKGGVIKV